MKRYHEPASADKEFAEFVTEGEPPAVGTTAELRKLLKEGIRVERAITVMHPYERDDCELLRALVEQDLLAKLFVIVWSSADPVRSWLEGLGAMNLHTNTVHPLPDTMLVEAGKCMVHEQEGGLSTGRGKEAVVQLVRTFAQHGYPVKIAPWLRAFFAAGGDFEHAESVSKLISEIQRGTKHRVKTRYGDNIFEVLKKRINP